MTSENYKSETDQTMDCIEFVEDIEGIENIECVETVETVETPESPHFVDITSIWASAMAAESAPCNELISSEIFIPTLSKSRSTEVDARSRNISDETFDVVENISLQTRLDTFTSNSRTKFKRGKYPVEEEPEPPSRNTRVCFVPHCDSGRYSAKKKNKINNVKDPVLFRVPQGATQLSEWRRAVRGRKYDRRLSRHDYICEYHFEERFIERYYRMRLPNGTYQLEPRSRIQLKPNAVPTRFNIIRPVETPRTWLRPTEDRNAAQRGVTKPQFSGTKKNSQLESPSDDGLLFSSGIEMNGDTKPEEITVFPLVSKFYDAYSDEDGLTSVEFEPMIVSVTTKKEPALTFESISEKPFQRPYWSKVLIPETNQLCYQYWKRTLPSGLPLRMVRVSKDLSVETIYGGVGSCRVRHEKLVDFSKLQRILNHVEKRKPCLGAINWTPHRQCKGYVHEDAGTNYCYQCHLDNARSNKKEAKISLLNRKISKLESRQKTLTAQLRSCGVNISRHAVQDPTNKLQPDNEVHGEMLRKTLLEEPCNGQKNGEEIMCKQIQEISLAETPSSTKSPVKNELIEASDDSNSILPSSTL